MSNKGLMRKKKKQHAESLGFNQMAHANRVLMKDLVFHYAQKLGLTNCYRCKKSLTREDFTIDHIESWRNKPDAKELFFDLTNIRFSHLSCNCGDTEQMYKPIKHGHSGYTKGCRCDICTEGHRKRIAERRKLGKMK